LLDDVGGKKLLADSLSCLFGSNEPLSPYDAFVRQKLEASIAYATGAVILSDSQQIDNAIKELLFDLCKTLKLPHCNFGPQHQQGVTIFVEANYATEKHEIIQSPFQRSIVGDNCHVKASVV
jgi:hypothetical protein